MDAHGGVAQARGQHAPLHHHYPSVSGPTPPVTGLSRARLRRRSSKGTQQTQETPSEGTETTDPSRYYTREVTEPPASAEAIKSSAASMPTPVWKLVKQPFGALSNNPRWRRAEGGENGWDVAGRDACAPVVRRCWAVDAPGRPWGLSWGFVDPPVSMRLTLALGLTLTPTQPHPQPPTLYTEGLLPSGFLPSGNPRPPSNGRMLDARSCRVSAGMQRTHTAAGLGLGLRLGLGSG